VVERTRLDPIKWVLLQSYQEEGTAPAALNPEPLRGGGYAKKREADQREKWKTAQCFIKRCFQTHKRKQDRYSLCVACGQLRDKTRNWNGWGLSSGGELKKKTRILFITTSSGGLGESRRGAGSTQCRCHSIKGNSRQDYGVGFWYK